MKTDFVEVNHTTIAYSVFGEPDETRPPVVATPSLFMDRTALYPLAAALAAQGRRVYVLDHRGQGESAPETELAQLTMPALAADNATFIEHLGLGAVDYLGTSQGGMVAGWLLAHNPHLLRSVVAIGSTADVERRLPEFRPLADHLTRHGATGELDTPDGPVPVVQVLTRIMFGRWTIDRHPALVEHWQNHFRTLGPAIGIATTAVIQRPALPDLTGTGVPVLAIAGAEDAAYAPEISGTGYAKATAGTTVTIERAGHTPATEHPDRVAEHVLTFHQNIP